MPPDGPPLPAQPAYLRRLRSALDAAPAAPAEPAALSAAAVELLAETFGEEATSERVASMPAYVALSGEHTHYFEGFALLLRLPAGAAVAVRAAPEARVAVRWGGRPVEVRPIAPTRTRGADTPELLARLLHALRERLDGELSFEAAVVAPVPDCREALLGAVAAAAVEAVAALGGAALDAEAAVRHGAAAAQEALGHPYGPAHLLAAQSAAPLALVDAATLEWEALEPPEDLAWGLVDTGVHRSPGRAAAWERVQVLREAVAWLQRGGLPDLRSLRELEHRDVPQALGTLFGTPKRVVRHVVGEDRRVPRLVTALRKGDAQVLGALLLMSQASLRADWQASTDEVEHVVAAAEEADGIYGARMTGGGYGGCVLVVGRPFLLPGFLDATAAAFAARFGRRPPTLVVSS
ncbi:MAG: galactokinase family protein [Rhodothermales bacterium]|nr:galactokinase family protein [Rhodothermales bacterium]